MKFSRFSILVALTLAACSGEKVQPENIDAGADLTPTQRAVKAAEDYKKSQTAFADSVLKNSSPTAAIAQKLGKDYAVGTVAMRDSLLAHITATPQCYNDGKNLDRYLAGTVTFVVHMSVTGSDVIRVQEAQWTSQAGNVTEKCFNDAGRGWKFPMGLAKQGWYLLQVQFK